MKCFYVVLSLQVIWMGTGKELSALKLLSLCLYADSVYKCCVCVGGQTAVSLELHCSLS